MSNRSQDKDRDPLVTKKTYISTADGFSLTELLVVMLMIGIMSAIAIYYATAHKRAYKPDDQALLMTDMLQEARQRALTQRRTMRVEVNLTNNSAKLYDENTNSTTANDDFLVKALELFGTASVRVDSRPSEITYNPAELAPVPNAVFSPSVYPPSISQSVLTIRFLANGQAVNAGTNAIGSGSVPTGVTLHVWSPTAADNTKSEIARAITVLGATGVIRTWEFRKNSTESDKWFDSRRAGSY